MRKSPIVALAIVALIGALGVFVVVNTFSDGIKLPKIGPECTVRADGEVTLDYVQMANAATITAVGLRRGMPERAVVIALATAFQESKLENLDDGDRDSVGLFQQRPSQGWGTIEQIKDPRYAANKFYASLKKVKGYQKMRVTDAAQKVQRSAYPNAYEKWADESAVLARALTGRATGAVECSVSGSPVLRGAEAAAALMDGLRLDWGRGLPESAAAKQAGGLTVKVADPSAGWRYAHWLVAHASATGLERVRFGDLEWHAPDGKWQAVTAGSAAGTSRVVAEVFN
ncbi:hypothetical protein Aab01nite_36420 [Paractinoplanes abujensis]|uniref:Uncharacterized protein n=1 Tax=Paractinoplanes abujensis TaxID=882441 RepID=A0A7W7G5B0_9ACTN|nr:hypothetical protein [Actinoplanes abujensis]MBB4694736.1 hypothetical protein [Actinoplanes abujensis]GID20052.1 hypothetical protein Aab01nite_36420 [Actinoplanes abujensis]